MPDVLILQHVRPEPPGTIATALDDRDVSHRTVRIHRDDPLFSVGDPFTAFHWHGDVFALPDGAVSLARSAQTEHQAFRYGENAYGLLCHLEGTPKPVAWMTTAFQDELAEEGLDAGAIRRAAMGHEPQLRDTARTVFGRWGDLVGELGLRVT